jgi:hypothetical protein
MVIRLDEKITSEYIFMKCEGKGMGSIDLAQVRGRWQALMNAVVNRRGPYIARNFLTS